MPSKTEPVAARFALGPSVPRAAFACVAWSFAAACSSASAVPSPDGGLASRSEAGHDAAVGADAQPDSRTTDAGHPASDAPSADSGRGEAAPPLPDAGRDVTTVVDAADARTLDVAPPSHDGGDAHPGGRLPPASCLGPSMALTIAGQMPYVDVSVGTESGEFVLDFGSTFSSIDLTAFASPGPTTSGCNSALLGVTCTVDGFAFFAPPGPVELTTERFGSFGGVRQAGILGTDFLSEHVLTLDYTGRHAYAATSASACTASQLTAAGYAALDATGFYENDLNLLSPATDVDSAAYAGDTVPDVPTVPVTVAGVRALAQLDTGFDDSVTRFSVNVNVAFKNAIFAADASALVRDASLDESLSTCVSGVSEPVEAYRVASSAAFAFVATSGSAARSYAGAASGGPVLFVKMTPSAAASCGGIGTWTVPAAQVGASFYVDMGSLVLHPYRATVWVPER